MYAGDTRCRYLWSTPLTGVVDVRNDTLWGIINSVTNSIEGLMLFNSW